MRLPSKKNGALRNLHAYGRDTSPRTKLELELSKVKAGWLGVG